MQELPAPADAETVQKTLVEALAKGAVIGLSQPVEHIQTHLNHVFLSGARAFKLKRTVRFPFVDFLTQYRRKAACEAEVSINKALGRQFDVGTVPVVRN